MDSLGRLRKHPSPSGCGWCYIMMCSVFTMPCMVRTRIQLTEEQATKLKQVASERKVSVAEVIRRAIDRELTEDEMKARWDRAIEAVRRSHFRSGKSDIAEQHDAYLAQDFLE